MFGDLFAPSLIENTLPAYRSQGGATISLAPSFGVALEG